MLNFERSGLIQLNMKKLILTLAVILAFAAISFAKPIKVVIRGGGPTYHYVSYHENWFRIKIYCRQDGNNTCPAYVTAVAQFGDTGGSLFNQSKNSIDGGTGTGSITDNGVTVTWSPTSDGSYEIDITD